MQNCPYYKNLKCPYVGMFCESLCIDCMQGILKQNKS